MEIHVNKKLYQIVKTKYDSLEYLLSETLPAISIANLEIIPKYEVSTTETVPVEISDAALDSIIHIVSEENTVDEIVNYAIGVGFVMEV